MSEVHAELVERFNKASRLARSGENEAALEKYEEAITLGSPPAQLAASEKFLVTCQMRAAFCLMDLDRPEEALEALDQALTQENALDEDGRYELHFARGNTLGQLGRLEEMFSALIQALSIAEDMDDYTERPARCWWWILEHGENAGDWGFVATKAEIALNAARLRGMAEIAVVAEDKLLTARGKLS